MRDARPMRPCTWSLRVENLHWRYSTRAHDFITRHVQKLSRTLDAPSGAYQDSVSRSFCKSHCLRQAINHGVTPLSRTTALVAEHCILPPGFAEDQAVEAAVDPDVGKTVVEIIEARGYEVETHKITTSDGYILTMYHISKTYDESQSGVIAAASKPAIQLQHGLLDSSFTFVSNFRNQSLAYVLADAGYDVWLGNRGTTWSNEHTTLTTSDDAYWDFTWEDMGLYDLPTTINYVLDTTGRSTLL